MAFSPVVALHQQRPSQPQFADLPDRVGLLYLITRTLAGFDLSIASARIATDIDHAFDTFYVADRHGHRIEDPDEMARVRAALEDALMKPL